MKGIVIAAVALLLCCVAPNVFAEEHDEEVRIGILSWTGPLRFSHRWKATDEYLTEKIGRPVTVLPLEFKDILPAVEEGKVDFFTADPSVFVTAKAQYGASAVLTMKLIDADFVGAVLFTAAKNEGVNELHDLKSKKFGAVRRWSFGGWQMAEKKFIDEGIEPYSFLHTLRFFDTPWAVVKAVLHRKVDAGTVPTSILERMAATGAVSMEDFKILAKESHSDFPYVCSTELYPGFPLAKTAAVEQSLADQVAAALKALRADDKVLQDAGISGWIDPLDYTVIAEIQEQLRGGGYTGGRIYGEK